MQGNVGIANTLRFVFSLIQGQYVIVYLNVEELLLNKGFCIQIRGRNS